MSVDEADMAAAKFMGALIDAAAELQRRQQERDRNDPRLKYAGEGGNVCISMRRCEGLRLCGRQWNASSQDMPSLPSYGQSPPERWRTANS